MTFESQPSHENPKDIFMSAVEKELLAMQESGKITSEQKTEKLMAASLIEEGFSSDPVKDAAIFSMAGIATEEEMIDSFNK